MQKRTVLVLLIPPLAVCRYGCAGCCAAPIGVFWLAGIVSFVYGFFGGPTGEPGISTGTLLFGIVLWGIATVWAETVVVSATRNPDACRERRPTLCGAGSDAETDPLDEVRKFREES